MADVRDFGKRDSRLFAIGGNTGTTNTYTSLDIATLTNDSYNGATLANGNNLECFTFQLVQSVAPTLLTGIYDNVADAVAPLDQNIATNLKGLGCPQLETVNENMYNVFPGYKKAKGF